MIRIGFGSLSLLVTLAITAATATADSQAVPGAQPMLLLPAPAPVAVKPVEWSLAPIVVLARAAAMPRVALPAVPAAETLRAECAIWQILATTKDGGVDPKLNDLGLKAQLNKPPFNSFKSFKLLKQDALQLADRKPSAMTLLTTQSLGLAYIDKLVVEGGKARMRMHLSLTAHDKAVLDTVYAIVEGGTLLQAGQSYQDGVFVMAIACHTK